MRGKHGVWSLLFVALGACADRPLGADASTDGRSASCATDADCANGTFCDGVERCAPGTAGADARGCVVAAAAPCMSGQTCDEAGDRCRTVCTVTEDADMDGATALECGGTDCDDADAARFPGNAEVCDDTGHDEDCNLDTIGARDADGDGALDAACCNVVTGVTPRCGTDCDDTSSAVRPGQVETCNALDDDCDGASDEAVSRAFFPDVDHDGWGDARGTPQRACAPPASYVENALDCNDADGEVSPSGAEVCNGRDDDCDVAVDEPASTAPACAATFGSPPHTQWECTSGTCATRCPTGYDDCDGEPSNGCEVALGSNNDNCGACGRSCGLGGSCTSGTCDTIVDVEAGDSNTCVIRSPSGRVVCWGGNTFGQLGDGTFSVRAGPTLVRDLQDVVEIDVQDRGVGAASPTPFVCALGASVVHCWGGGQFGQLGGGTASAISATPVAVAQIPHIDLAPADVEHLSVGAAHACVTEHLSENSTGRWVAACWGRNDLGQIGTMPPNVQASPVYSAWTANSRAGVPLVAAGANHTCVAWTNGSGGGNLTCWGQIVGTWTGVVYEEIDSGQDYGCGRASDGRVLCWSATSPPTALAGVTTATHVSAGTNDVCATLADGSVTCWDWIARTPYTITGLTGAIDVSAGGNHACALTSASEVWCWGRNYGGELGQPPDVTDTGRTPLRVPGI